MAREKSNKSFLSKMFKLLYYLVISFVCLIVGFLIFYIISSQLHANDEDYKPGVSIYTIVSPSMTPVIKVYDVVVNVKVNDPTDINVGDIITYKSAAANSEGMTITHRVIDVSTLPDGTYEYMTQGDNNSEPDSVYVTFDNVIGKEILIIPYLGKVQMLIANQKGWLFLLLIPVSIYLIIEVIKLIDLFSLRKKVNKVVGTTEDNFIEKKRIEKLKEEERKEKLKEELAYIEVKKDSKQKSSNEPDSFLEKYTETVVNVKENKYANVIKPKKAINIDPEPPKLKETKVNVPKIKETIKSGLKQTPLVEPVEPTALTESVESVPSETPVIPVIEEKIEILDTDELTSKIKEYDDKIEKLDNLIKDMETSKSEKKPKVELEEEDYLKGSKIRVTNIEDAKKRKRTPKNTDLKLEDFTDNLLPLKEEIKESKRETIERPVSEDIAEIRAKELSKAVPLVENTSLIVDDNKKEKLNLNPNNVKKINRPNKKRKITKNVDIKISLNPNTIKKVERPTKKKIVQKSSKNESTKKNKKPLIIIEKKK